MLEALKFVQRGVARRDLVPGLTHFRIKDKRVTGFNGAYALSAPVDIGFNVAPAAGVFIKALDACEDVITLQMDGANLLVRSGNFRTVVPCIDLDTVPETLPEGEVIPTHESILAALGALKPFVGIDASRQWACGVLLANESAFATNNVIVVEYWLGSKFPRIVNVPSAIVEEVIKVNEELTHLQIAENTITFHYKDGRWIKSQLLDLSWPNVIAVLDQAWQGANLQPVPPGLMEACLKLARFGDKDGAHCHFRGKDIATHKDGAIAGGALVELPGVSDKGCYHTTYLNKVLEIADRIDFSRYPGAIAFGAGRLRGAMVGVIK